MSRVPPSRLVVVLALAVVTRTAAASTGEDGRWVGTWAASPQLTEPANMPPEPGLADSTLRQIVHVSVGGKRLRVRFSNAFGTKPLTILSAHLAASAGGSTIKPGTGKPLTFGGRDSVEIPTGAPMVSDPIDFDLAALSDLAVTIRVKDATRAITGHPGARCTSYLERGDKVTEPELPQAARTQHWYYLCGVDVEAADGAAVAVLGDSITDGRGSPTDGNGRWTDHLARRLCEGERTARVSVLNQGLGGNRMLHDGLGPSALARLDRDVLSQPGVRWLIVLEGINDLGTHSATARDLIAAYDQIIVRSHARGIRVYGATVLPCEGSFYFNRSCWRPRATGGQRVDSHDSGRFDAVIDFDGAATS